MRDCRPEIRFFRGALYYYCIYMFVDSIHTGGNIIISQEIMYPKRRIRGPRKYAQTFSENRCRHTRTTWSGCGRSYLRYSITPDEVYLFLPHALLRGAAAMLYQKMCHRYVCMLSVRNISTSGTTLWYHRYVRVCSAAVAAQQCVVFSCAREIG